MAHDVSVYRSEEILDRIDELACLSPLDYRGWMQVWCQCDDFEVDDGELIRDCPWNTVEALEGELLRRELEAGR